MKKILTVSLVAMMAVSTARADIASTAYVQGAVSAEAALRAEAVEGINEELAKMATSSTVAGIQNTLSTLQTTVANNKETTDQTQADLDTAEGKITALEGTVAGHTEDISEINTALAGKQATIDDLATIRTGAAEGATAVQLSEVKTGSANGTISVQNTDVAVKGLGSAAYTASTAYATSAQGTAATAAKGVTDAITGATAVELGGTGADGKYVLTMVKNGTALTYKWEAIAR